MARWGLRRWSAAALGTLVAAMLTGLPTVMVPNPWFTRMVPVTSWDHPVWIVTSVLAGLLFATYVTEDDAATAPTTNATHPDPTDELAGHDGTETADELDAAGRRGGVGAVLTYFAIGCPVCNKLVVLALGTSGAMSWFAPAQPLLAAASIGLLAWGLRERLRSAEACPAPASTGAGG